MSRGSSRQEVGVGKRSVKRQGFRNVLHLREMRPGGTGATQYLHDSNQGRDRKNDPEGVPLKPVLQSQVCDQYNITGIVKLMSVPRQNLFCRRTAESFVSLIRRWTGARMRKSRSCRRSCRLEQPRAAAQLFSVTCRVSSRYFRWESMSCSTVPSPGRGASKSSVIQPV